MTITQQHSSLSSFMSGLLMETIRRREDQDDRVSVYIVEDNAKALQCQLPLRCRSLVSMERRRSPKPDCRWSSGNNGPSNRLSSKSISQPRRGRNTPDQRNLRKATSDTELLRVPQRSASPRITKGTIAPSGTKSSPNATWDQTAPQTKKANLFEAFLQLSPDDHAELLTRSNRPRRTLTPPISTLTTPLTRPSNTKMAVKSPRGVSQFNPSEQRRVKKSLPQQKVGTGAMSGVPIPPQHMTGVARPPRQPPAA